MDKLPIRKFMLVWVDKDGTIHPNRISKWVNPHKGPGLDATKEAKDSPPTGDRPGAESASISRTSERRGEKAYSRTSSD